MNPEAILKLLIERRGKRTQEALAKDFGVTPQYISDIFKGRRTPGSKILSKLGLIKVVDYKLTNKRKVK